jgi:hypothetical protein
VVKKKRHSGGTAKRLNPNELGKTLGPLEGVVYASHAYLQAPTKEAQARMRLALDKVSQEEARRADLLKEDWQGATGRRRY